MGLVRTVTDHKRLITDAAAPLKGCAAAEIPHLKDTI
jgi:hypothetical protein